MTPAVVIYVGLVIARIGAFVGVMPLFGARTPRMVRVGLAVALAAFYLGIVAPEWDASLAKQAVEINPIVYALAVAREALIGAAMGFVFGLFLLPAQIAGDFLTHQVGLNINPETGAASGESAGVLVNVFEIVAGLVFLIADGHHVVLAVLHASFAKLPLGGGSLPQVGQMLGGLSTAYELGILLAGPLTLCLFLLAVTMAIMARAAPQLSVYSVGFTLQILVVLVGGLFLVPEFVITLFAIIDRTGSALTLSMGG